MSLYLNFIFFSIFTVDCASGAVVPSISSEDVVDPFTVTADEEVPFLPTTDVLAPYILDEDAAEHLISIEDETSPLLLTPETVDPLMSSINAVDPLITIEDKDIPSILDTDDLGPFKQPKDVIIPSILDEDVVCPLISIIDVNDPLVPIIDTIEPLISIENEASPLKSSSDNDGLLITTEDPLVPSISTAVEIGPLISIEDDVDTLLLTADPVDPLISFTDTGSSLVSIEDDFNPLTSIVHDDVPLISTSKDVSTLESITDPVSPLKSIKEPPKDKGLVSNFGTLVEIKTDQDFSGVDPIPTQPMQNASQITEDNTYKSPLTISTQHVTLSDNEQSETHSMTLTSNVETKQVSQQVQKLDENHPYGVLPSNAAQQATMNDLKPYQTGNLQNIKPVATVYPSLSSQHIVPEMNVTNIDSTAAADTSVPNISTPAPSKEDNIEPPFRVTETATHVQDTVATQSSPFNAQKHTSHEFGDERKEEKAKKKECCIS